MTVFKDSNYNYIEPYTCNVLSCAALKSPKLIDGLIPEYKMKEIYDKIDVMFSTALSHNNRKLVLGAWGCGAYHCPPKQIAEAFKKMIYSDKFINQFEEIRFAVWNNPDVIINNYVIFHEVFGE